MGTIVLGLLIAIALEQTVEFMHNRHLSHELEEQMRVESEQNLSIVSEDLANMYLNYDNLDRFRAALEAGTLKNGKLIFNVPSLKSTGNWYYRTPSRATWTIANAAGRIALLPADKAKAYARLDFSSDFAYQGEQAFWRAESDLSKEVRLAHVTIRPGPATVTPQQRDAILRAVAASQDATATLSHSLALDEGALKAVRDGVSSVDQIYAYQQRESEESGKALEGLDK